MSSQYDTLIATRGKLPFGTDAMSDLLVVYRLDWIQYFVGVTADTNTIEQCNLRYNSLIISCLIIINTTLPNLGDSMEQEIGFEHQDVIPDEPAQILVMIMKQD